MHQYIAQIRKELEKLFPEVKHSFDEETPQTEHIFYLHLDDTEQEPSSKSKKMVLKLSREYMDFHSLNEIIKHLRRNIFYVLKSNINKRVYLLKHFEIQVEELAILY